MRSTIILSFVFSVFSSVSFAETKPTVWDLGILALATHDLRAQASERDLKNVENSRFDLSTLFNSADGRGVKDLGHQKNTFNTMTTTVCRRLADYFFQKVREVKLLSPELGEADVNKKARELTVKYFIENLQASFERITGLDFPTTAEDGDVSHEETIALLIGHDLLPGKITAYDDLGRTVDADEDGVADQYAVANRALDTYVMNDFELGQRVNSFDGEYDPAFRNFERKEDQKKIDLMAIDKMVIGFLDKTYDFDGVLAEIGRDKSIANTRVGKAWVSVMAKGINPFRNGQRVAFVPALKPEAK